MNSFSDSGLRWMVVDMNSYFASCEQQERPELRGRPVAVVPTMAETTCAIAASYEAKAQGVKTGTLVREARQLCPDIVFVQSRPKLYVAYHQAFVDAIESCVPVEDVMSIDEVACRLDTSQRSDVGATILARAIKEAIRQKVGAFLTCSIGAASNRLLAKLALDMQKPDGLVLLPPDAMPGAILHLPAKAICGIGSQMAARLERVGLDDMAALWGADQQALRRVWGGVTGARFYQLLHGADLVAPSHPRRSLGRQHVLAPVHRSLVAAEMVLRQLLARAAEKMRHEGFYAKRLMVDVKWMGDLGYWVGERRFGETRETQELARFLAILWREVPRGVPLRVGVTLADLVAEGEHQRDLFEKRHPARLSEAVDGLNRKFGRGTLTFGAPEGEIKRMEDKIAFQAVPDLFS